ncbi:MAG: zinc-dependent metalloprotease [Bryobacterales bacterium]|nr:zinc-dependent metalloprotease [Bryobacterales bacterium]
MKLRGLLLFLSAAVVCFALHAQNLERKDGFIPLLWDEAQGKLYFEIAQFDKDILYFSEVAKGSGSGSVGLEWAAGGEGGGIIQFQRVGPRVLVIEKNLRFRSGNGGAGLEKTMDASFPDSILASLPIVKSEAGKVVVDATNLVVRDAPNFASAPAGGRGEGGGRGGRGGGDTAAASGVAWRFDPARSAIYLPRTKAFPKNTEVEVTVTYEAQSGGARTTPQARILTGRLHYSFVEPPSGYTPREADPRIGVGGLRFSDYSASNSGSTTIEWVRRHRLEKKDPNAAIGEPKQPLVYYLDASIPEPTRSAIKDGVLWWNKAFEAAGFKNAVEIRDAPLDMDIMDVRYNQIYWVDRDERGYSTGGGLTDPRTGEIIAARVRLESDRVRTASRYWQSYMPGATGGGGGGDGRQQEEFFAPLPTYSSPDSEQQLSLLREALLAAHEVGHSLGFAHNWDSSINDRASVMEYPSPRIKLTNGKIDLTDAYQKEIGAYDIMMVRYAYTEFPKNTEKAGLNAIIADMRRQGLIFTPSTDPRWNRYDDLADPAEYLRQTAAQRKVLLQGYGPNVLKPGEPYGNLRGIRLWMVYLHHRWAIDTGVRYIGGMYHNIVVKGETLPPTEIVPAAKQREVLGLLLDTLDPANLAIPEPLLASLTTAVDNTPRPVSGPDLENFEMATGYAFDHLSAARTIAGLVFQQLFEPDKAARLISFADRQPNALTLPEVIEACSRKVWAPAQGAMNKSLQRQTQRVFVEELMTLGAHPAATPDVKAVIMAEVAALHAKVAGMKDADPVTDAHLRQMERDLQRLIQNGTAPRRSAPPAPVMAPI